MALLVLKYGGSSLSTPSRVVEAARQIARRRDEGFDLIVVVSAMGDTTDQLLREASRVAEEPPIRELDMLLTAGERISMALLAMALHSLGREAISFTGSQSGIITDALHTRACIVDVRAVRIREELDRGRIVIVAGFQGVSSMREVTTLGRGGSDTTAVALAAAFGAVRCDLLTDVAGVYTADPRIVPDARLIPSLSYEEMGEMAALGADVVHVRSSEIARHYSIPLRVVSSVLGGDGTMVTDGKRLAEVPLRGVSHVRGLAKVTWRGVPGGAAGAARVVDEVGRLDVVARMLVQTRAEGDRMDLVLVCPRESLGKVLASFHSEGSPSRSGEVTATDGMGSVSVIGHGVSSLPGTPARVLETLAGEGVEVDLLSSTSLSISCLVKEADVDRAVRALHRRFLGPQDGGAEAPES